MHVPRVPERAHIANELYDLDERSGRRLRHGKSVEHFGRLQPAIGRHAFLRDIAEHGVGAAESHDRHLGKKHGDFRENIVRPKNE